MKILLTGSTGLLGTAIVAKAAEQSLNIISLARKKADVNCDLTDQDQLKKIFAKIKPNVVINAAANINHDDCEKNPGYAYAINARSVSFLAELCRVTGAYLVHISTDHYYTGDGNLKHTENDPIIILNEYARTKYLGEALALTYPNSCVIRTNIVGFRNWENPTFVEWVIKTLQNGGKLNSFHNYYTSSIDTESLAEILLQLIQIKPVGIFNVACGQVSSKDSFIRALAERLNLDHTLITTSSLQEAGLSTRRGDSLGLDVSKAEHLLKRKMPDLNKVINNLADTYLKDFHEI